MHVLIIKIVLDLVESNNTWCLKHNFTTVDSPVELPPTAIYPDPDTIAPPKIFPAPKLTGAYQNLPVLGNVIDPDSPFVNLNSFIESKASPSTSLLPLSPSITADSQVYAVGTDGFTLYVPILQYGKVPLMFNPAYPHQFI